MEQFHIRNPEELKIYRSIKQSKSYQEKGEYDLALKKLEKCFSDVSEDDNPFLYNMIMNEMEISQKKVLLESKPRQLGVNLTHNCNIKCRMCFYPDSPWDIPKKNRRRNKGIPALSSACFLAGRRAFCVPIF